jgi:hypothetical protein
MVFLDYNLIFFDIYLSKLNLDSAPYQILSPHWHSITWVIVNKNIYIYKKYEKGNVGQGVTSLGW